ncbi:H(+)-transporting V1 sector ATPase subunit H [Kluyveromyces marxianus]|nr:H(+)-transporting V1 sector ATPase subunit H [Kluyveromyces marxianus]
MNYQFKHILLDSTHFQQIRHSLNSRTIGWDALVRSSEISKFDGETTKKLESGMLKNEKIDMPLDTALTALLHILATSNNLDVNKCVVNLLSQLLTLEPYSEELITLISKKDSKKVLSQFYEHTLNKGLVEEQFNLVSAFTFVSLLLQFEDVELTSKLLENKQFQNLFKSEHKDAVYLAIRLLQELTVNKTYKQLVWSQHAYYLPIVFESIFSINEYQPQQTNTNNLQIQLQYYALMIIWLLTFDPKITEAFTKQYLSQYLQLLALIRSTIKEKVVRLSVSIILNGISDSVKNHKSTVKNLILLGNAIPTLNQIMERKFLDDELKEDLATLKESLETEYHELTSFDEYMAELNSKILLWSPVHQDSQFWLDNLDKFKENNWKLFTQLIDLLKEFVAEKKPSAVSLQILLNDIRKVMELDNDSIKKVQKDKLIIMQLLQHQDSKVKYEALKTTQVIVSNTFK